MHGIGDVTFFQCPNGECLATVSFGGTKKVGFGAFQSLEAESPINNFNRRADNG